MKKLFYLAASPRYTRSKSREMGKFFVDNLKKKYDGLEIDMLNIDHYELPPLSEEMTNARYKHSRNLPMTPAERLAWDRAAAEFRRFSCADLYLFATPMWNYSLPGTVKRYLDTITHPRLLFEYEGDGMSSHVNGKPLVVIYASGGLYDTPESAPLDGLDAYLKLWNSIARMKLTAINYGGQDLDVDHAAIQAETERKVLKAVAAL